MRKFLRRYTDTIFIMLGSNCNLHCRYCLQQCQDIPQLPKEINPDIFDFIRECCEENGEDGDPILLQFYGGEPLIYFDKIREVVEQTKYMNVVYSVISNGRALTEEMVEFFNYYRFNVSISWDGPNVRKTRKFDVMKENGENIMKLNCLCLSAVISAESYPKEVLASFEEKDKEYHKLHPDRHISTNLDYIFDTGIADKALIDGIDYDRMKQEAYELTVEFIEAKKKGKDDLPKYAWQRNHFYSVGSFYENNEQETLDIRSACCTNGYKILNMDLDGNLYFCHNIFEPAGSIYSIASDYFKNITLNDNATKIRTSCNDCVAVSMCYGGCKLLVPGSKEKDSFCKIRQAIVGGVVKAYIEFGKEAKKKNKKKSKKTSKVKKNG